MIEACFFFSVTQRRLQNYVANMFTRFGAEESGEARNDGAPDTFSGGAL